MAVFPNSRMQTAPANNAAMIVARTKARETKGWKASAAAQIGPPAIMVDEEGVCDGKKETAEL